MIEPQYDAEDMHRYYDMKEFREMRKQRDELLAALKVIHASTRTDEKGEQWTIRKWLDEHGVFNDDIQSSKRLVETVCVLAIAKAEGR